MTQSIEEFREDFGLSGEKREVAEHPLIDRSRWGLFEDVDVEQYHGGNPAGRLREGEVSISQSQMGRILDETPLDFAFHHPQLNPDREKLASTVAQHRGDLVHQLALGKGRGFQISPHAEYRTAEAKAWKAGVLAAGKTPVKQADFEAAEVMADVIKDRIAEALNGCEYQTEVAFLYQHMTSAGPVWVRGMVDVWCPDLNIILDVKTTPMIYDTKVERQLVSMGWDRQAALYSQAFGTILGPVAAGRIKFRDLMVKPTEPFTTRLVELDKAWHWSAWKQCEEAIERFGRCLYAGRWPGFENLHRAQLPTWEDKRREAAEMGGE
jgi:hypothetical protein